MNTVVFPPVATAPPQSLVSSGKYNFGTYDQAIPDINPLDAAGTGPLAPLRRQVRNSGLKEWEAFQLGDDDRFVLGAVYNAKSVGLLQVLVVDKNAATIARWETKLPSAMLHVARGLDDTVSEGEFAGLKVEIGNNLPDGVLTVDAVHRGTALKPELGLHITGDCAPGRAGHLVIVHPFSENKALYSHKAMMPASGSLLIGGEHVGLADDRGYLILDDHHGDYPRPMKYDWVTGIRRNQTGVVEGFNLTHNQTRNPGVYNENALWIGDQVHRLPPVTVTRPDGPWGKWFIRDAAGIVDVTFTPTVRSTMHVGPRKMLAEYYAPYGWYEGMINAQHATLNVDGMFGVGEQKRITV
ncbi:DUF2804 family protein [Gordonia neofelifaecis]|uniref:Uncharacterized protein n=1 Tax=Gordonia neofelifaecis NRRL B-59395 TaxID=644548 RepID=F1YL69_9ACTN|nr:DUF2804 family protein [Gordonia neofelifaecis]EGD54529.1 hypothetical protein SCNU_13133 [Gordonia neofelifaecis NRRL B-59395]